MRVHLFAGTCFDIDIEILITQVSADQQGILVCSAVQALGRLMALQYIAMSMLEALAIAGFRSYSPQGFQKLEFQTPLTLIWGKNGSGKTTIIEVLKYITTGALPPSCDKGKNFLMDPKLINESELTAETRLKFKAFNGRPVLAKRRALISVSTKGVKFESVEQTLKTKDENGELFEINHQCAEIEKQIPQLLGISKAVLQNIVFCHQEESLWPFSDNANLKAIFDEMFETRRYTKIIDAFWEQHKEYTKEIKETKKSMEYLKRLYDDDNRRKLKALRETEAVAKAAAQLPVMREKIKELEAKGDPAESMKRKYLLGQRRGALKEKLTTLNKNAQDLKGKMKSAERDCGSKLSKELPVRGSGKETLFEIDRKIEQAKVFQEDLRKELDQCQNAQMFSQKQMEISGQVKRAKQCLPQLKNEEDEVQVLKVLESRCLFMENRRAQLAKLRRQAEQLTVPSLLDLPLTETAYREQKRLLSIEGNRLATCKQEILSIFVCLFKPVPAHPPRSLDKNIEQRLQEVRLRLKLKREQLDAYQSMPEGQSFEQRRIKLEHAVTFQHEIIGFCQERKKCFVCSKQLNDAEIKNIKTRSQRAITKNTNKLEEIKEDLSRRGEEQGVDPKQMIPVLKRDIGKAEEEEAKLALEFQEYSLCKQHYQQEKLNSRLMAGLKRVGLDRETRPAKVNNQSAASFQAFQENIMEYESLRMAVEGKSRDLRLYEERVQRNEELQRQRDSAATRNNELRELMAACEKDTMNYELFSNISKRLSALLAARGSRRLNSKSKQKGPQNDAQKTRQRISQLSKQIRALQYSREYCLFATQLAQIQPQVIRITEEMSSLEADLSAVELQYQQACKLASEKARLQTQYATKKREIDLKADLAFQEYHVPIEKEYIAMQYHLSTREAAAKDIEAHCKGIESAVCAFHKDKMELVNKYLAEIWREVYHGDDITLIQIQANYEEDSKKRRSYSYAIVMQKGGKKLQMKGRCSMGQKVLASIVIRLALAQVFANSARILALDEPTTNLDRQHIVNLAQQLARLVQMNENKYLQMIIISHDLEFVRMMEKYTTCYYEVSRNERRCSVINKKEIREIYEAKLEGQ